MFRSRFVLAFLASCTIGLSAAGASAAEYYLSPTGDDVGNGSAKAPWRSLDRAHRSLKPGDTLLFLPGEYPLCIAPAASGKADAPITYRSAEWRQAILRGTRDDEATIDLSNRSHIRIQDFTVSPGGRKWLTGTHASHFIVSGNRMERAGKSTPFDMRWIEHFRLTDNVFSKDQPTGNMVQLRDASYGVIEGNAITRVGHSPLRLDACRRVVIRANTFYNDWGRNYEFTASGRLLIEGNIVTEARDSAHSADSRAKNAYIDSIFRFNQAYGNTHTALNSPSYFPMVGKRTGFCREPFRLVNSRFYHNTIVDNLGYGWELGGMDISANLFINNIFYRNDLTGEGVQLRVPEGHSYDNRYIYNLLGAAERGRRVVRKGNNYWTAEQATEKSRAYGGWWREFDHNIDADPRFANEAERDLRLSDGSPAIDAGRSLTIAIGKGKGRALPVADPWVFYDGFGIEGETGDLVQVGEGGPVARILRVEDRYYQAGLLHLDREVAWTDAQAVSLPWHGKEPDLGAYEKGGSPMRVAAFAMPVYARPGQEVTFSVDGRGRKVKSVAWDLGDNARSNEAAPKHAYATPERYVATARIEFADGSHGVATAFVKVAEPVDPRAPLVVGDFEDGTHRQWDSFFKFYRRSLTGYERPERGDGAGKCIRLFVDPKKTNYSASKVAPGMWEIDKYPLIRFSYRIPRGTPVGLYIEPFADPDLPRAWVMGGTDTRRDGKGTKDLKLVLLKDDDQWHTVTLDLRDLRWAVKDLRYVRQFRFLTRWEKTERFQFWFDDFLILPPEE